VARKAAAPPRREEISGVILAGGRGMRMGGVDKGWVQFQDRPLVAHVLERFSPQVGEVLVSANRNVERYRALGYPVFEDESEGDRTFSGPLAGMAAGLAHAAHAWVAFVPCDAPALAADLVARLAQASGGTRAAFATCGGVVQPVFCLLPASAGAKLQAALAGGERRPREFLRQIRAVKVPFEDAAAFINVNRTQDALGETS
jgi:molybdenum cofactor guanylyltransferase